MLTGPFTPMLFMGEEWGARTPWQFFTDHTDPELAEAVRTGRRREFGAHGWAEEDIPDPQDPATRARSCLDWDELHHEPHARLYAWYRELIALRRTLADLRDPDLASVKAAYDDGARWLALRRGDLRIAVNLDAEPAAIPLGNGRHRGGPGRVVAAWLPVDPPGPDGMLHLPPESCVVLADD